MGELLLDMKKLNWTSCEQLLKFLFKKNNIPDTLLATFDVSEVFIYQYFKIDISVCGS